MLKLNDAAFDLSNGPVKDEVSYTQSIYLKKERVILNTMLSKRLMMAKNFRSKYLYVSINRHQ